MTRAEKREKNEELKRNFEILMLEFLQLESKQHGLKQAGLMLDKWVHQKLEDEANPNHKTILEQAYMSFARRLGSTLNKILKDPSI